jgi:hypothetical protein
MNSVFICKLLALLSSSQAFLPFSSAQNYTLIFTCKPRSAHIKAIIVVIHLCDVSACVNMKAAVVVNCNIPKLSGAYSPKVVWKKTDLTAITKR